MKTTLSSALSTLSELNKKYQDGEWDVESLPQKPPAPIMLRAEAYKAEIKASHSYFVVLCSVIKNVLIFAGSGKYEAEAGKEGF